MVEHITFVICGILVLGIFCQWLAWWVKMPAILFLLIAGLIAGPYLHLINPDKLFGDLFFPMISIAVAIILFEGSLSLKFSELGSVGSIIRNLVTFGFGLTVILTMILAHLLFHFSWSMALLFGAMTSIGGPTVVAPILRSIRLKCQLNKILQWESILIDPIGALVTVLIFSLVVATMGDHPISHELLHFAAVILVGSAVGIGFGFGLGQCIQRLWIPEYLTNVVTLSTVVLVYSLTDWIDSGGGLLAASLMGITMANMRQLHIKDILHFKESLSILMISGLFIVLAARIQLAGNHEYIWLIVTFFALAQFVIRPLAVWLSTLGSELTWREKTMLSWICPRGIMTAAVAALFSYKLLLAGQTEAKPFVILSFGIILTTVIFESLTAKLTAMALKEYIPHPNGVLIIGSNPFSIALAQALSAAGIQVMIVCKTWHNLIKARAAGIETFYGDAMSKHTTEHLDTTPYGYLFALSAHHEYDVLCCLHYKDSFETGHVMTLQQEQGNPEESAKPLATGSQKSYQRLFSPSQDFCQLADDIQAGKTIQSYTYPEDADPDEAVLETIRQSTKLIAISPDGMPAPYSTHQSPALSAGWTLLFL